MTNEQLSSSEDLSLRFGSPTKIDKIEPFEMLPLDTSILWMRTDFSSTEFRTRFRDYAEFSLFNRLVIQCEKTRENIIRACLDADFDDEQDVYSLQLTVNDFSAQYKRLGLIRECLDKTRIVEDECLDVTQDQGIEDAEA